VLAVFGLESQPFAATRSKAWRSRDLIANPQAGCLNIGGDSKYSG
jgi:hypothetical protein